MTRKLALYDMDGTLSDDSHRRNLYVPGIYTPYWDREQLLKDKMWFAARLSTEAMRDAGWHLGVLSARSERNREVTEEWLEREGVDVHAVWLKGKENSYTENLTPAQFKLFKLIEILASGVWDAVVLYDNDREVVDLVKTHLGTQYVVLCSWDVDSGESV
jgi:hypothetical protein